jgi:hypothetical protein
MIWFDVPLPCLQVAGLPVGQDINKQFENLYQVFIQQLQVVLPPGTNIPVAYESGTDEEQNFVQNLALFLTAFFKVPLSHSLKPNCTGDHEPGTLVAPSRPLRGTSTWQEQRLMQGHPTRIPPNSHNTRNVQCRSTWLSWNPVERAKMPC